MSPTPPRVAAVLLAAGSGSRVGAETNKVLLPLRGVPVLAWSLRTVRSLQYVEQVVVVCRPGDRPAVAALLEPDTLLVDGGSERHDSEWHALQKLAPAIEDGRVDIVVVHDAARPLATPALWDSVVEAAALHGGALPTHRIDGIVTTQRRPVSGAVAVQTPQAFRAADLLAAYRAADRDGFKGTDTASCLERYGGVAIAGVPSPATNLKITFRSDLTVAERLLPVPPGDAGPSGR